MLENTIIGNTQGTSAKKNKLTLAQAQVLFIELCLQYEVDPMKIIRRSRNAKVCEARILIIKDMYKAGARTWQIKEIIPRDDSTLRYSRNKV